MRYGVQEPGAAVLERLLEHHAELRRWNRRLSLIGPGTVSEVVERHYAESLAAVPLLPGPPARVLDLGSGAGFPGWVLAAARPELEFVLAEPNERKRYFLESAARRAELELRLTGARVPAGRNPPLPTGHDVVTVRALALDKDRLEAIGRILRPGGRLLWWIGEEAPPLPGGARRGERIDLRGNRAILAVEGLAPASRRRRDG